MRRLALGLTCALLASDCALSASDVAFAGMGLWTSDDKPRPAWQRWLDLRLD